LITSVSVYTKVYTSSILIEKSISFFVFRRGSRAFKFYQVPCFVLQVTHPLLQMLMREWMINDKDLAILWMPHSYNCGEIIYIFLPRLHKH